ncbi:MAG: hypothetical protein M0C28_08580 [Candidatus Moduliflexus flocculans]|nr:hypothetical protein [Candidatus Moduliflexus flocculans]
MKLSEVKDILEAEVIVGDDILDLEVKTAFGADLMSDVLAFAKAGSLLLTGLTNTQVIRTANVSGHCRHYSRARQKTFIRNNRISQRT